MGHPVWSSAGSRCAGSGERDCTPHPIIETPPIRLAPDGWATPVERQLRGVWFDHRAAARLREEAPSAYKDIDAVMRAQKELTRIIRRLRPVLCYKGT